jgi:hypothetical protein
MSEAWYLDSGVVISIVQEVVSILEAELSRIEI